MSQKLDGDDFARIVIDFLRQNGIADPIDYDSRKFRLTVRGEAPFCLANLYKEYSIAGRRERISLLNR